MSSAKDIIYHQQQDMPATPVRKGTKGRPASVYQQAVPFATAEASADVYPTDHHMINRNKAVTGKAGADGFDSSVYLHNRADNVKNMAESKFRNYTGAGAPYAQNGSDPAAAYGRGFHKQELNKALPDKIGAAHAFDSEAYRQQLAFNAMVHEQTRQQKYGSAADGGSVTAVGGSCPFAVSDSDETKEQWQRGDYHAKSQGKVMAQKVGSDCTFDAGVYSNNRQANKQHQAESCQRNFVGGGDILAFPGN